MTTAAFNSADPVHLRIKKDIEVGDGLPDITDGQAVRSPWRASAAADDTAAEWNRALVLCQAAVAVLPNAHSLDACPFNARSQVVTALRKAGFVVEEVRDLALESAVPWYGESGSRSGPRPVSLRATA